MSQRSGTIGQAQRAVESISHSLGVLSGVAILLIMASTVFEVGARYLVNRPTSWSVEVSSHLLIAPVFLAAGYTLLKGGHVNMEIVVDHLPRKAKDALGLVTSLAALGFLLVLTWQITGRMFQVISENQHSPGILQIPLGPGYIGMSLGSVVFCLALAMKIIEYAIALWADGRGAAAAGGSES